MQKIMFNDKYGLTKAVLEGRKTMTRRLPNKEWKDIMPGIAGYRSLIINSPFKVGEVVAVAQSYKDAGILYDEHTDEKLEGCAGWTNKMFVASHNIPHQIRITNVRVERLQDISDEDCLREGIRKMTFDTFSFDSWKFFTRSPREAFAALIDKVSGKGIWNRNPWVFVYEFELVK